MVLPTIDVEYHLNGDGPAYYVPDREFWRYLLAAMATQGMLANSEALREARRAGAFSEEEIIAHDSVVQADALLAELEREKGGGDG